MKIILRPPDGAAEELELFPEEQTELYNGEELQRHHLLRGDAPYGFSIDGLPDGEYAAALSSGDSTYYCLPGEEPGSYLFMGGKKEAFLFRNQIGLVSVTIYTRTGEGVPKRYLSERAEILVRSGAQTEDARKMLDYIYDNEDEFLYTTVQSLTEGSGIPSRGDSLASRVRLLSECADVYESCYGFFKANAHYKLEKVEKVDLADKLQYVDEATFRYMVQHPDLLRRDSRGIQVGGGRFLPYKTLMIQNRTTVDIYENQIIVAFLKRLLGDARDLREQAESLTGENSGRDGRVRDYVISSSLLTQGVENKIAARLSDLSGIEKRLMRLYGAYRRILSVADMNLHSMPRPSAVMMQVPQYHMIFVCMTKWFELKSYSFRNEKRMLQVVDVPAVYEVYVLVKILRHLQESGYHLLLAAEQDYGQRTAFSSDRSGNNVFVYENADTSRRITVYYQPVISDWAGYEKAGRAGEQAERERDLSGDLADGLSSAFAKPEGSQNADPVRDGDSGSHSSQNCLVPPLRLYRAAKVTMSDEFGDNYTGSFYRPDYVIASEQGGRTRYLVCDAKYKRHDSARFYDAPRLSYKYLISLKSASDNAELVGLAVIYGRTENYSDAEDFFDRQGATSPSHQLPEIILVPLSERIDDARENKNLRQMLDSAGSTGYH